MKYSQSFSDIYYFWKVFLNFYNLVLYYFINSLNRIEKETSSSNENNSF